MNHDRIAWENCPSWDDPHKDLYWSSPLPGKLQITCNFISGKTIKISIERLHRFHKIIQNINKDLEDND